MVSLKNLTGGQLKKMLANANAEIKRREHIQAATAEIQAILTTYKITIQDIDPRAFNKKAAKKLLEKARRRPGLVTTANMSKLNMSNQIALRLGVGAACLQPGFVKSARKRGLS